MQRMPRALEPRGSRPRRFDVPLLPMEERLLQTDVVCLGRFVCPPTHPLFTNSGPATTWCIAFPRRSVWIRHRDDAAFVADATLATLYNRGDEYERVAVDDRGDYCDWLAVAPDVLLDIATTYDPRAADRPDRPFGAHRAGCDHRVYLRQRCLFEYVSGAAAPDLMLVDEEALRLVARLMSSAIAARPVNRRASREIVEAARAVLAVRFADNLTLRGLADLVGASPYHLCHTFRAVTGTTITKHRDQLRLRASLELLGDHPGRLIDLALELGYSSHSHFTAAFRHTFQTTPSRLQAQFAR